VVLKPSEIPLSPVRWNPCYRIIPSRFPPIQLFEEVADPADLEAVFRVESLTNERLRDHVGELTLVPPEDRVSGAGSSYVMAAFTHPSPVGGRFTDDTFGAFYTARDRQTAIDETVFHRERFLRDMAAPPTEVDMRVLRAKLDAVLHDLRGKREAWPEVYRLDDYSQSQALGRELRTAGSWGIAYDSVRGAGGECAAVLRPPAITRCRQAEHLGYVWEGERIALVYEKKVLRG
jgi:hypothetical protein